MDARVVSPELRVLDYPTAQRSMETVAADSEMSRLRVQAKNALAAAKAAVASDAPRVREWPGTALAVAAILGLAIGVCTGRTVRRGRRS